MKVSSISAGAGEASIIQQNENGGFMQIVNLKDCSLLKELDRIGTSIALGETGDLDAAHEFRQKNSGR